MCGRLCALALLAVLAAGCAATDSDTPRSTRAVPGFNDNRRAEQINTPGVHIEPK